MTSTNQPTKMTFPCAMSGEMETLVVEPIGRCGVSFSYGEDASVIVDQDDLIRLRTILDGQIANWEAYKAEGGRP